MCYLPNNINVTKHLHYHKNCLNITTPPLFTYESNHNICSSREWIKHTAYLSDTGADCLKHSSEKMTNIREVDGTLMD